MVEGQELSTYIQHILTTTCKEPFIVRTIVSEILQSSLSIYLGKCSKSDMFDSMAASTSERAILTSHEDYGRVIVIKLHNRSIVSTVGLACT
jgi:hypothetical protein